jgi:hypothetical protein
MLYKSDAKSSLHRLTFNWTAKPQLTLSIPQSLANFQLRNSPILCWNCQLSRCYLFSIIFDCHFSTNSESQSYFTTGGLPPISLSWYQAPWDQRPVFFFQLNICCYSPYITPSLTRGWVCCLQLLLALTSAVILGSESRETHDHILLSQIRASPNLDSQVPVFISPWNRVAQSFPQALGSLFITFYDSQGYAGGIRTRLKSKSHCDWRSVSQSVLVPSPIWGS